MPSPKVTTAATRIIVAQSCLWYNGFMAHTGTRTNNKSYQYGVSLAVADLKAGLPRNLTYQQTWGLRRAGKGEQADQQRRDYHHPIGLYGSDIERAHHDTYDKAELAQTDRQTANVADRFAGRSSW